MRIFIKQGTGKIFPIEAESFDTIRHVKRLIQVKEKFHRLQPRRLVYAGRLLEDSKTLADYYIQNESTLYLTVEMVGGIHIRIKASINPFIISIWPRDPTINDVKAAIEEEQGIPVKEQRLVFSGKELDDGGRTVTDYGIQNLSTVRLVRLRDADDAVDIAAVKARKKEAALSKDKETGNPDEAVSEVSEVPEVGSKRAREDSERGLSSCGANRVEGMESFWDEEDSGLAWRRSRSLISPFDTSRFESISHRTLIESVANDCVRTLNVTAFLENQLKEYKEELSRAENEVKRLTERNSLVHDSLQKETDRRNKLLQELDVECSTGSFFFQSEIGRRHIESLERQAAKSAVDEFKKSGAIHTLVKGRSSSAYDDAVEECQSLLRKSGRVSEDIIHLIGPQNEEQQQHQVDEEQEDNDESEEEDDDVEMGEIDNDDDDDDDFL